MLRRFVLGILSIIVMTAIVVIIIGGIAILADKPNSFCGSEAQIILPSELIPTDDAVRSLLRTNLSGRTQIVGGQSNGNVVVFTPGSMINWIEYCEADDIFKIDPSIEPGVVPSVINDMVEYQEAVIICSDNAGPRVIENSQSRLNTEILRQTWPKLGDVEDYDSFNDTYDCDVIGSTLRVTSRNAIYEYDYLGGKTWHISPLNPPKGDFPPEGAPRNFHDCEDIADIYVLCGSLDSGLIHISYNEDGVPQWKWIRNDRSIYTYYKDINAWKPGEDSIVHEFPQALRQIIVLSDGTAVLIGDASGTDSPSMVSYVPSGLEVARINPLISYKALVAAWIISPTDVLVADYLQGVARINLATNEVSVVLTEKLVVSDESFDILVLGDTAYVATTLGIEFFSLTI